jgi:Arc/MetJ-type ribon-helix-helix transcriptional regulator
MKRRRERFYLDPEDDADIATWLDRQENKSAAIRAAIRKALDSPERLGEEKLRRVLREELARAQVTVTVEEDQKAGATISQDVDPEAGQRLDDMF